MRAVLAVLLLAVAVGTATGAQEADAQAESPGDGLVSAAEIGLEVEIELLGEGFFSELRRNVRAQLAIAALADEDESDATPITAARVRRLHRRAEEQIRAGLEPFGYYRPQIEALLETSAEPWKATYRLDPGPRVRGREVDVRINGPGAGDPELQSLVADFPLSAGAALYHPAYESGKEGLRRGAERNGYLSAEFEVARVEVDVATDSAVVVLHLATGPQYRFGAARFEQELLKPELLRGYVSWEEGDPFDFEELLIFQDALSNSPYFRRVEIEADPASADERRRVPVVATLVPAAAQEWDLGVGYGTDTGPRGSVGLDLRRINRSGHRGRSAAVISDIERSFEARYLIPGAYPRTDVLTFTLGYQLLEPDTSSSETFVVGLGRTRSIGRWREALGLTFRRADFEVGVDRGISELLVPDIGYSRVKTDDRIFATHGRRLRFELRGAAEDVGSNATFARLSAETKVVRSLADDVRILGRLEAGYLATDDFRRLPPEMRFFAGGDASVRGFGYQELGGVDEQGNVIGGETLLTGSLEIESMFLELERFGRWGAAAFFDFGNASNELGADLERGAGVGLRWLSPIGLVRADLAWAISREGSPLRFHLMIGPDL